MTNNPVPCQTHQPGYATLATSGNSSVQMTPWATLCTGGPNCAAQAASPAKSQSSVKKEDDTCAMVLSRHVWGSAPRSHGTHSDVLYQTDINIQSIATLFELAVWKESQPDSPTTPWNDICNPYSTQSGFRFGWLTFRNKPSRNKFLRWKTKYSRWFSATNGRTDGFLPILPPGKFSGAFVEQKSDLDRLGERYLVDLIYSYDFTSDPCHGLIELLPAWGWIVANCRRPVYWKTGGWLFSSHADAAKFTLFDPARLNQVST